MWEYLTGVLPRWPFRWPLRGHKRLEERVSGAMVRLLRKSLEVDPAKRFARGDEMLSALLVAAPVAAGRALGREVVARRPDWRRVRREAFRERYGRVLGRLHACVDCGEPVAEAMAVCPWCGSERNVFDERTEHDAVCPRCRRGVRAEWRYCPWCWGAGFAEVSERRAKGVRSVAKCGKCGEGLEQWMRYCPWCHAKLERGWQVRGFPEVCGECGGSVDTEYWRVCPWCGVELA